MERPAPPSPAAGPRPGSLEDLELVIEPRARDLDGLILARLLPAVARQLVGPFIFLDHFGPALLRPPQALDVRPHPHIGLATVTYLLEGEILHRDSLGSSQVIRPGAVNWMIAGRGIVHSERTPTALRGGPSRLHGLQLWVALPRTHEEAAPEFRHHPAESLPVLQEGGVELRLLAGEAFGARAPARTSSPLFLLDVSLPDGALLPVPAGHADRGAYVVAGGLQAGSLRVVARRLAVLRAGTAPRLVAAGATRVLLLGGEPPGERRHAWWNFVSSSRERIEEAKAAWAGGRFPRVPGDEIEFTPLPARHAHPGATE
jgi:redox-sensitive bicupin YhaK (pirin superfamily)